MPLDIIDPIERISILFKLIKHYFNKYSIEFNIKLAIDLANAIDYINTHNVTLNNTENSEYSRQLHDLLKIILDYYPKILKDLNKIDKIYTNNYLISDRITNFNPINIINCNNEYNEIDYVVNYINNNINKNITIISTNEKILNLLTIRLDLEGIKNNSKAQYNKNYYKISSIFKNKIDYYFNDINDNNLIKIIKLLSFLDITYNANSNINICDFQSLNNIQNSDIVFCLSMNNETWHVKNNMWISNINNKYNIYNIFNYIVNNSKSLYCLYSSVVNGKVSIKSSILNKLEVDNKNNLIFDNYILPIDNNKIIINNNSVLIPKFNDNLIVLSGSDVRNLLYDQNKFYFNNVLNLKKEKENDENSIYILFKDIFHIYFNKNYKKTYDDILKIVEKLDPLYFKKFKQIINYLNKNNDINNNFDYVLNNDMLETIINNNIIIKTHCDRLEINNNKINIKKYCVNNINSKSSILSGKEFNLLTQSLILKNNKIINEFSEINLEIIVPDWKNDIPIYINKFSLPVSNIDNYLGNIINTLENYNKNNIIIDNNEFKV